KLLPRLRRWKLIEISPKSTRELLALYNCYNYRHVKIAGYNNGSTHFGQKFAGQTIVKTTSCGHYHHVKGHAATFDAGVTLRRAIDIVDRAGKEFGVLPNYSYISVGTSFFVPVHGSASDCSTLGETIERVLLYDPAQERFHRASRQESAFRE